MRGHRLEVWRLALLPDDKTLVSGSKDGEVCFWDTSVAHPHQPRITFPDYVESWCFAPDSQSVLTLNQQGQVAGWSGPDFRQQEPLLEVGTNFLLSTDYNLFSRDGRFLAAGSTNGTISVWNVSQRILRCKFKAGEGPVQPEAFLAHGNRLICWTGGDNRFSEWDLEGNQEIQSWPAPPSFYEGFGVSPDERLGIGVGWQGDVIGRNLPEQSNTNLPMDVLEGWTVVFSADGKRLVVSSALGYARVWDTVTWREEARLRGFLNAVDSAVFSPDGRRLATCGSNPDDAVKLWDVDSWQEVLTLEGAGSQFDLSAFSPDGNTIGAMSGDGHLNLWRAPSWTEIIAAEAKDPPSPGHGGQGKAGIKQP